MLQGKQLARGVRCIKLVSEALLRLLCIAVLSRLDKQGSSPLTGAQKHLLQDVQHAFYGNDQVSARQFLNEVETDLPALKSKVQQFSESGVQQSVTFKGPILYCFSSIPHSCQRSISSVFDMHCPKPIRGPEFQLSKSPKYFVVSSCTQALIHST